MSHTEPTKIALVLGARGRFGRNMSEALTAKGWSVRPFDRATDNLAQAAQDADIIVHGWNPTYDKWEKLVADQTQQIIAAARIKDATVLIPGNVYCYGVDGPAIWRPDTPHRAQNTLGRIRRDMEQAFKDAGTKTIILRAGDFLDTQPSGNWFDLMIVKPLKKGKISYPGNPNIPHAWAYLPDFTMAFALLAEKRAALPRFTTLNFGGYTMSGIELAQHLRAKVTRLNWLPIYALAPFWKMARHFLEMRYLWNKPHQLDGSAFEALVPEFRATPAAEAVRIASSFQIDPDKSVVGTYASA